MRIVYVMQHRAFILAISCKAACNIFGFLYLWVGTASGMLGPPTRGGCRVVQQRQRAS